MKPCGTCPKRFDCRVPHDMALFDRVAHRLEEQRRNPLLQHRLHHYADLDRCLVDAGYVDG